MVFVQSGLKRIFMRKTPGFYSKQSHEFKVQFHGDILNGLSYVFSINYGIKLTMLIN